MDSFLEQLARRLRVPDADILSADEVADWPEGKLDELISKGIIREIEHAKGVVCKECEENCSIEPDIRTNPGTGKVVGVFLCTRNPDIGRIEVDIARQRQWQICKDKLEELGLFKKKAKRKKRQVSSELSVRERQVYQLVHVRGLTQGQASIEMNCSAQNVSQLLKKAEKKVNAQSSRSVNLNKAQQLPKDRRGQISIPE